MTTWLHEWLFRRPSTEGSRCRRTWDLQEPGGPHLRREPLLSEALREESRPRRISSPEEEPRIFSEAGRESHEAAGGGPEAEAFRHPPRAPRLHTRPHGGLGESLDNLPRHSPDWIKQEKGGRSATERDEFERAAWRVLVAAAVEPERLLFVDECGVHTSLAPIYGYAPRDERLHLPVPRNRGKNTTLLSSMTTGGMGPSLAVEGATTARVFETYVEKVLVPSLRAGQIVVMDNLSAHRPRRIRELIEQQGCELLYLPAYSPDYNPIEEAFAKIKNLLRKAAVRSKGALVEAIGQALSAVTIEDALGYFEHAGYRPTGQLL
jgi:transposase